MSDPRKLGRLLQHDPKSRDYPAQGASQIKTVIHQRHCTAFDQGDTSSCTGNAMAGALMTDPLWRKGRKLDEVQARILYGMATKLDGPPGEFPPDDTGSSGLGVAKAAKALGYISAYHHAFELEHALAAVSLSPIIVGLEWLEGCDEPDKDGLVSYKGRSRGGHEVEAYGLNVERRAVHLYNSWGRTWGLRGTFSLSFDDFGRALANEGDVEAGDARCVGLDVGPRAATGDPAPSPSRPAQCCDRVRVIPARGSSRRARGMWRRASVMAPAAPNPVTAPATTSLG